MNSEARKQIFKWQCLSSLKKIRETLNEGWSTLAPTKNIKPRLVIWRPQLPVKGE